MARKPISENVKRKLWAESMGYCMNPDCRENLFLENCDIMEKAHIYAYSETEDNSYENLIILCPNCHKKFDKGHQIDANTVKMWKKMRREELERFFSVRYDSFSELQEVIAPLLSENLSLYNSYYDRNRKLWDKFEPKILSNNEKIKYLLESNLGLFQNNRDKKYSNLEVVRTFITHVDEFKNTRCDEEKERQVLFPQEINSMFGIEPIKGSFIPSTEALECLIQKYKEEGILKGVELGINRPYILLNDEKKIFLDDDPRLRQLYFNNKIFIKPGVRLESLNFILKYLKSRGINFAYNNLGSLTRIKINNTDIVFVYQYCLSRVFLNKMLPKAGTIIVNLHNWNGKGCISKEAFASAKDFNVKLLTQDDFIKYVNSIR
jgi:hypothetical protein